MDFEAFPIDEAPEITTARMLRCSDFACVPKPLPAVEWTSNQRFVPQRVRPFQNSIKEGALCEARFKDVCAKRGIELVPTSEADDMHDRIDVAWKQGEAYVLADIKAARRLRREDANVQCEYVWLELHATGSLFTGKSNVLIMELEDGFVLIDKARAREWVKSHFSPTQRRVGSALQALMKPYRRAGKYPEWITLVKLQDLVEACGLDVWN